MRDFPQPSKFPYNKACIVLAMGLALILLGAHLHDCLEVLSSFMFGLLIIWQVINGLIIKRKFWHIPEEKTTFWALIVAVLLSLGMLLLSLANTPGTL